MIVRLFTFLCIALLAAPPLPAIGGKIYRWVDEKGVVHFSDRMPDGQGNRAIEEREVGESGQVRAREMSAPLPAVRSPIEHGTWCTFTIRGANTIGTGFFINSNGYAATASHVVAKDWSYVAVLNDKREFPIKVITMMEEEDLALLLLLNMGSSPFLSFRGPATLVPGERVFAIGASAGLSATVTDGVFTGFRRVNDAERDILQFSAPINPGNSGGPLIDKEGKVIGIISKKYLMRGGVPIAGVGFAVPSSVFQESFGSYLE
jgi:S1-C subfamily serine protease